MTPDPSTYVWYVVDDHTVVQSWFNPERERTEYVQYETTKPVSARQLQTATADFHRVYRSGEWLLLVPLLLALAATIALFAGIVLLPTMLENDSSAPLVVVVASAVTLTVIAAVLPIYRRRRMRVQQRFVAELGSDQRSGHTLKKQQVEQLVHAPGTVTVRPAS